MPATVVAGLKARPTVTFTRVRSSMVNFTDTVWAGTSSRALRATAWVAAPRPGVRLRYSMYRHQRIHVCRSTASFSSDLGPSTTKTALRKLPKPHLEQELRSRGLPPNGTKLELVDRLLAALRQTENTSSGIQNGTFGAGDGTQAGEAGEASEDLTLMQLQSWNKTQIQSALSLRGLPKTGRKALLVNRLWDEIQKERLVVATADDVSPTTSPSVSPSASPTAAAPSATPRSVAAVLESADLLGSTGGDADELDVDLDELIGDFETVSIKGARASTSVPQTTESEDEESVDLAGSSAHLFDQWRQWTNDVPETEVLRREVEPWGEVKVGDVRLPGSVPVSKFTEVVPPGEEGMRVQGVDPAAGSEEDSDDEYDMPGDVAADLDEDGEKALEDMEARLGVYKTGETARMAESRGNLRPAPHTADRDADVASTRLDASPDGRSQRRPPNLVDHPRADRRSQRIQLEQRLRGTGAALPKTVDHPLAGPAVPLDRPPPVAPPATGDAEATPGSFGRLGDLLDGLQAGGAQDDRVRPLAMAAPAVPVRSPDPVSETEADTDGELEEIMETEGVLADGNECGGYAGDGLECELAYPTVMTPPEAPASILESPAVPVKSPEDEEETLELLSSGDSESEDGFAFGSSDRSLAWQDSEDSPLESMDPVVDRDFGPGKDTQTLAVESEASTDVQEVATEVDIITGEAFSIPKAVTRTAPSPPSDDFHVEVITGQAAMVTNEAAAKLGDYADVLLAQYSSPIMDLDLTSSSILEREAPSETTPDVPESSPSSPLKEAPVEDEAIDAVEDVLRATVGAVAIDAVEDVLGATVEDVAIDAVEDVLGATVEDVAIDAVEDVLGATVEDVAIDAVEDVAIDAVEDVLGATVGDVAIGAVEDVLGATVEDVAIDAVEGVAADDDVLRQSDDPQGELLSQPAASTGTPAAAQRLPVARATPSEVAATILEAMHDPAKARELAAAVGRVAESKRSTGDLPPAGGDSEVDRVAAAIVSASVNETEFEVMVAALDVVVKTEIVGKEDAVAKDDSVDTGADEEMPEPVAGVVVKGEGDVAVGVAVVPDAVGDVSGKDADAVGAAVEAPVAYAGDTVTVEVSVTPAVDTGTDQQPDDGTASSAGEAGRDTDLGLPSRTDKELAVAAVGTVPNDVNPQQSAVVELGASGVVPQQVGGALSDVATDEAVRKLQGQIEKKVATVADLEVKLESAQNLYASNRTLIQDLEAEIRRLSETKGRESMQADGANTYQEAKAKLEARLTTKAELEGVLAHLLDEIDQLAAKLDARDGIHGELQQRINDLRVARSSQVPSQPHATPAGRSTQPGSPAGTAGSVALNGAAATRLNGAARRGSIPADVIPPARPAGTSVQPAAGSSAEAGAAGGAKEVKQATGMPEIVGLAVAALTMGVMVLGQKMVKAANEFTTGLQKKKDGDTAAGRSDTQDDGTKELGDQQR